jgi:hypothetical protein
MMRHKVGSGDWSRGGLGFADFPPATSAELDSQVSPRGGARLYK